MPHSRVPAKYTPPPGARSRVVDKGRYITIPYQGDELVAATTLLLRAGIEFDLDRRGLTVHLADGMLPERAREVLDRQVKEELG